MLCNSVHLHLKYHKEADNPKSTAETPTSLSSSWVSCDIPLLISQKNTKYHLWIVDYYFMKTNHIWEKVWLKTITTPQTDPKKNGKNACIHITYILLSDNQSWFFYMNPSHRLNHTPASWLLRQIELNTHAMVSGGTRTTHTHMHPACSVLPCLLCSSDWFRLFHKS